MSKREGCLGQTRSPIYWRPYHNYSGFRYFSYLRNCVVYTFKINSDTRISIFPGRTEQDDLGLIAGDER